jgi:hypothetical protein
MTDQQDQIAIEELEHRTKKLERTLKIVLTACLLTVGVAFFSAWTWQEKSAQVMESLRVRQITVVDEKGTERIYIGSPLPDPVRDGKRIKRRMPSTGIAFNNAQGSEINGWAAFDDGSQVFCFDGSDGGERLCLTQVGDRAGLVIKDKEGRFLTLFGRIGYEEDAPKIWLSDFNGRIRVKLQVDAATGAPKFEMLEEKGKQVFLVPEAKTK